MYNLTVNTCHRQDINGNDVRYQHFAARSQGVFEDNILHRLDKLNA